MEAENRTNHAHCPPNLESGITLTGEELIAAAARYEAMMPSEVKAAYEAMLGVPVIGIRIAMALQLAAKDAARGILPKERIMDAAVLPAFLIGLQAGMGRADKSLRDSLTRTVSILTWIRSIGCKGLGVNLGDAMNVDTAKAVREARSLLKLES